ncbi:MAG: DUF1858 domain-containing protein [Paracoccaceae bacterium]
MLLRDVMEKWPQTIPVFIKHKMLCVGCVITPYHTIQDACSEHKVSEPMFRSELLQAMKAH